MSLLRGHRLKALLRRMLAEVPPEFGVRALSKYHDEHPFLFEHVGQQHSVNWLPGEATAGVFGGNSNWRSAI